MVETGVTRRIDDLGRVVIPKEIRRSLHLSEGVEMSFFVDEGRLVLEKFSLLKCNFTLAQDILKSIHNITRCDVLISDMDNEIYSIGAEVTYIPKKLISFYSDRNVKILGRNDSVFHISNFEIIVPIVLNGDVIGGMVLFSKNIDNKHVELLKLSSEILCASVQ